MLANFRSLGEGWGALLVEHGSTGHEACAEGTLNGSMAAANLKRWAADHKYPGFSYEEEGQWKGPFCFIQSADTQFGLIDSWNKVTPEEDQKWDEEIRNTKKAIQAANSMCPKPKFFIVCGDMVNAFPWEKHNDQQVKDFAEVFQELEPSIPLVCVCGNHDVGDTPTQDSLQKYRSNFGDDFFSFWVGGKAAFQLLYDDSRWADKTRNPCGSSINRSRSNMLHHHHHNNNSL